MAWEIERKFLVRNDSWRNSAGDGITMKQGYLATSPATVRVRVAGNEAFLTLKAGHQGIARQEFEYPIPVADAEMLLALCCNGSLVEKVRYPLMENGKLWTVDVFAGRNSGLVVAEIELSSIDESIEIPAWAGEDVSGDRRYSNAALVKYPFDTWEK